MKAFFVSLISLLVFGFVMICATQHSSKPVQVLKPTEPLYKKCSVYSGVHYDRCLNNLTEAETRCSYLKNSTGYLECIKKYGGL